MHVLGVKWLLDIIFRADVDRFHHEMDLIHGGDHHDNRAFIQLHDFFRRVDPAEVRHHDVHRDDRGSELAIFLDRFASVGRFADDLESGFAQDLGQGFSYEGDVIDDQYSFRHNHYSRGSHAEREGVIPAESSVIPMALIPDLGDFDEDTLDLTRGCFPDDEL